MLYEFLMQNELELVARYRVKVANRYAPQVSEAELEHGIPSFLRQLIDALRTGPPSTPTAMAATGKHGTELLRKGVTVAQVVHDYGDLCDAVTELAAETNAPITANEFHAFNRCLEDAIAGAVTAYARFLAHELRNLLGSAILSFDIIKNTSVALDGGTSARHDRALRDMGHLIDRSLADTRQSDVVPFLSVRAIGAIVSGP